MDEHNKTLTGRCLCGAVKYEATTSLAMGFCHCRSCQRSTGAGGVAWILVPADHMVINGKYKEYQSIGGSGKAVHRAFCSECGSRLFFRSEDMVGLRAITASSLDDPTLFKPTMRLWIEEAQPWDCMTDECVRFARGPA